MSTHVSPRLSSNRDEYEISDAVDLLIYSGRTIDVIGWEPEIDFAEGVERVCAPYRDADAPETN